MYPSSLICLSNRLYLYHYTLTPRYLSSLKCLNKQKCQSSLKCPNSQKLKPRRSVQNNLSSLKLLLDPPVR